ncbi:hypothetical protein B0J17DRAFT_723009 [Rhizoctonia solani]|nr:hypothetical protein B0J17DRAFT_723009 [Rhizoctonia solani]
MAHIFCTPLTPLGGYNCNFDATLVPQHRCQPISDGYWSFLFACNVHKTVFQAFNCFGFSTAHSTVHQHLCQLGTSALEALVNLAKQAHLTAINPTHTPRRYFLLIYNNINKFRVPQNASVAQQSHVASGTAATAIVMENIPPGAFNPAPYLENIAQQEGQNLKLEQLLDDIQHDHL